MKVFDLNDEKINKFNPKEVAIKALYTKNDAF